MQKIGCDWEIDSEAIEDPCGICKGTGVGCKHEQGDFTTEKLKSNINILIIKNLPVLKSVRVSNIKYY